MNTRRNARNLLVCLSLAQALLQADLAEAQKRDASELDLAIGDGAELLVIDGSGLRTGFDPVTGQRLEQIRNSAYFRDALQDDVTGQPSTETTHLCGIHQPSEGVYNIIVTGLRLGTYMLSIRTFSQDGTSQPPLIVSGVAGPGSSSSFSLQLLTSPGSVSSVMRVATFQSTVDDINNSFQLGLIDDKGIATSLVQKIQAAQNASGVEKSNILNAFLNEVNVQVGKHITGPIAEVLRQDASSLISQKTTPDTTITSNPPVQTNGRNASFSFASTEPASTFSCSLDGAAFSSCTSPKSYSGLSVGSHTFQVVAIDSLGNVDQTPSSFTWTVIPLRGDLNGDGKVDTNDLSILLKYINQSANGPDDPRDLNHDGVINALDSRILTTLCTNARCAIQQ